MMMVNYKMKQSIGLWETFFVCVMLLLSVSVGIGAKRSTQNVKEMIVTVDNDEATILEDLLPDLQLVHSLVTKHQKEVEEVTSRRETIPTSKRHKIKKKKKHINHHHTSSFSPFIKTKTLSIDDGVEQQQQRQDLTPSTRTKTPDDDDATTTGVIENVGVSVDDNNGGEQQLQLHEIDFNKLLKKLGPVSTTTARRRNPSQEQIQNDATPSEEEGDMVEQNGGMKRHHPHDNHNHRHHRRKKKRHFHHLVPDYTYSDSQNAQPAENIFEPVTVSAISNNNDAKKVLDHTNSLVKDEQPLSRYLTNDKEKVATALLRGVPNSMRRQPSTTPHPPSKKRIIPEKEQFFVLFHKNITSGPSLERHHGLSKGSRRASLEQPKRKRHPQVVIVNDVEAFHRLESISHENDDVPIREKGGAKKNISIEKASSHLQAATDSNGSIRGTITNAGRKHETRDSMTLDNRANKLTSSDEQKLVASIDDIRKSIGAVASNVTTSDLLSDNRTASSATNYSKTILKENSTTERTPTNSSSISNLNEPITDKATNASILRYSINLQNQTTFTSQNKTNANHLNDTASISNSSSLQANGTRLVKMGLRTDIQNATGLLDNRQLHINDAKLAGKSNDSLTATNLTNTMLTQHNNNSASSNENSHHALQSNETILSNQQNNETVVRNQQNRTSNNDATLHASANNQTSQTVANQTILALYLDKYVKSTSDTSQGETTNKSLSNETTSIDEAHQQNLSRDLGLQQIRAILRNNSTRENVLHNNSTHENNLHNNNMTVNILRNDTTNDSSLYKNTTNENIFRNNTTDENNTSSETSSARTKVQVTSSKGISLEKQQDDDDEDEDEEDNTDMMAMSTDGSNEINVPLVPFPLNENKYSDLSNGSKKSSSHKAIKFPSQSQKKMVKTLPGAVSDIIESLTVGAFQKAPESEKVYVQGKSNGAQHGDSVAIAKNTLFDDLMQTKDNDSSQRKEQTGSKLVKQSREKQTSSQNSPVSVSSREDLMQIPEANQPSVVNTFKEPPGVNTFKQPSVQTVPQGHKAFLYQGGLQRKNIIPTPDPRYQRLAREYIPLYSSTSQASFSEEGGDTDLLDERTQKQFVEGNVHGKSEPITSLKNILEDERLEEQSITYEANSANNVSPHHAKMVDPLQRALIERKKQEQHILMADDIKLLKDAINVGEKTLLNFINKNINKKDKDQVQEKKLNSIKNTSKRVNTKKTEEENESEGDDDQDEEDDDGPEAVGNVNEASSSNTKNPNTDTKTINNNNSNITTTDIVPTSDNNQHPTPSITSSSLFIVDSNNSSKQADNLKSVSSTTNNLSPKDARKQPLDNSTTKNGEAKDSSVNQQNPINQKIAEPKVSQNNGKQSSTIIHQEFKNQQSKDVTGSKKTLTTLDNILEEHEEQQSNSMEENNQSDQMTARAEGGGEQGDLEGEQIETIEIVKSKANQQPASQHDNVPNIGTTTLPPTPTTEATPTITTLQPTASPTTTAFTTQATMASTPPTEQTLANLNPNLNNNIAPTTVFPFVTVEVDKAPEDIKRNNTKKEPEPTTTPTTEPTALNTTAPTPTTKENDAAQSSNLTATKITTTIGIQQLESPPKPQVAPQIPPPVPVDQHLVNKMNESNNTLNNTTTAAEKSLGSAKKHLTAMKIEQSNEILRNQPNDAILIPGENRRKVTINQHQQHASTLYQDKVASKRTQQTPSGGDTTNGVDYSFEEGLDESENLKQSSSLANASKTETFTLVYENNDNFNKDNFIQEKTRSHSQHVTAKEMATPYTPNPNLENRQPKLHTPPSAPNYYISSSPHLENPIHQITSVNNSTSPEHNNQESENTFLQSNSTTGFNTNQTNSIIKYKDEQGDKRAGVTQHYSSFTESEEDEETGGAGGANSEGGFLQKDDNNLQTPPTEATRPTKSLNPESHLDGLIRPTIASAPTGELFIVSEDEQSLKKTHLVEEKAKSRQMLIPVMINQQQQQTAQVVASSPQIISTGNQPSQTGELPMATIAMAQQTPPEQPAVVPQQQVTQQQLQPQPALGVNNAGGREEVWQEEMNMEDMYWTDAPDEIESACRKQRGTNLVVRVMSFGDSLTRGYYNKGQNHHPYTGRLQSLLNRMDNKRCFIVENQGKDGDVAFGEMPKRMDNLLRVTPKHYDWVIILGGTNDIYNKQHAGKRSPNELSQNIIALHNIAHHHGARTVAITIPEVLCENVETCEDMKQMRDNVNDNIKSYALDHKESVVLCDMAELLARHKLKHGLVGRFFEGGLHLRPRGYETMARLIFDSLKQVID